MSPLLGEGQPDRIGGKRPKKTSGVKVYGVEIGGTGGRKETCVRIRKDDKKCVYRRRITILR